MIPPVPPGIREIDPDAEAARLAERRKQPREMQLCHEVCRVWDGSAYRLVRIIVSADGDAALVPFGLAERLAEVVRAEVWPA